MSEHSAIVESVQQSLKCPYFQQTSGGCPYDPKHPKSVDASMWKQCPTFKNGCPWKDVPQEQLKKCPVFGNGKCPFDSNKIDLSRLKDCPPFKNGCPYMGMKKATSNSATAGQANLDQHQATVEIAKQSRKCPIFQQAQGGCPYDPKHPHAMDMSKVSQCPAFQAGCPYKDVKVSERLKDCPAFKDNKCPFDSEKVDLSRLKDCPAFAKGCPYMNLHPVGHGDLNTHQATDEIARQSTKCPIFQQAQGGCPFDPKHPHSFDMSQVKQCPAFEHGCPYKDVKTDRLSECPAFKDGKCPFDGNRNIDLSRLKECPAFQKGCPYTDLANHHQQAASSCHGSSSSSSSCHCPYLEAGGQISPVNININIAHGAKNVTFSINVQDNSHINVNVNRLPPSASGTAAFAAAHHAAAASSSAHHSSAPTSSASSGSSSSASKCPFTGMSGKNPHSK